MASLCKDPNAPQNLRIVLLGASGVGKSATGNAILGRETFTETRTRMSEIQKGSVEERNISVIDTPGFINTEMTDEDLQNEMMKSLCFSHPGPHVFLLIIRPDIFTERDVREIVEKIQETFGAEVLKFTLVLFTGRERMAKKEWSQFIENENVRELLSCFGGRYHTINSKSDCDSKQVMKLLKDIDKLLKINAGEYYTFDIYMKNKLKEQKEGKKEELLKSVKTQEERDSQEENKEIKQEEETKAKQSKEGDDEGEQHDVNQECEEYKSMRARKDKLPNEGDAVQKDLEYEKQIEQMNLSRLDLRIVLVGKTGSGKSATGNTILGRDVFKEDFCAKSVTRHCEKHETTAESRNISVIDTPGLFDTTMTNEEVKEEIVRCVEMSAPGPHVFLLIIRLDVRFTDEEKKTVKWIEENFSADAMNYAMVLFTRGDQLDHSIEDFLKENAELKDLVDKCKGGYHVFNNKDKNQVQVIKLLEKIDKLVMENGGEHYTNDMYREAQRRIVQEQERQKEEEERKRKEEEEMIRKTERDEIKGKVKKAALTVGSAGVVAVAAAGGPTAVFTVAAALVPAAVVTTAAAAAENLKSTTLKVEVN